MLTLFALAVVVDSCAVYCSYERQLVLWALLACGVALDVCIVAGMLSARRRHAAGGSDSNVLELSRCIAPGYFRLSSRPGAMSQRRLSALVEDYAVHSSIGMKLVRVDGNGGGGYQATLFVPDRYGFNFEILRRDAEEYFFPSIRIKIRT